MRFLAWIAGVVAVGSVAVGALVLLVANHADTCAYDDRTVCEQWVETAAVILFGVAGLGIAVLLVLGIAWLLRRFERFARSP
jgi:hypothetical protein